MRPLARVVCFGELLLRLSAPGREKLLQSPQLEVRIGGAEANVGVSLSCFGHQVAAVGTVADNALGEAAAGELRRYGVDTTGLRKVAGRMGLYFLAPGAIHRPAEVLYDRAGSAFATAPAEAYDWPALLRGADWLHLSGVTPAMGANTAAAALAAAHDESAPPPARRIRGGIYVSCAGRGGPHFGAPNAELQIIRHALGDVPLAGFLAGGEIARHHLYGYTGVLTVFVGTRY